MRLASTLTALASPACIIPTPIEAENPIGPANYPPVIVAGEPVDFSQGDYTPVNQDDAWAFGVTVRDPDAVERSQTVEARLYVLDGTSLLPFAQIPLTATPTETTKWTGQGVSTRYCRLIKLQRFLMYVYVSDAGFPESGNPEEFRSDPERYDGHYDFKYWVVQCPGQ